MGELEEILVSVTWVDFKEPLFGDVLAGHIFPVIWGIRKSPFVIRRVAPINSQ